MLARVWRTQAAFTYSGGAACRRRNDWGMMTMRWTRVMLLTMMTTLGAQGAMAAVAVTKADFGKLSDGKAVDVYTLKNADLEVRVTTYGARVVSLMTKDRDGKVGDVVLGY